jgi:galactose mutarotase-like enzyme
MITLQNDLLTAIIASKGAELQQLVLATTGINYMWSGNATYWGKYSPVLFPIVGGLKDDTYYYNGMAYKLPRHGFARDKVFTANQLSNTEALFTLTHDDDTMAVYPFPFTLHIRYTLRQQTITCTYEVINTGNSDMLFSIGAHPAFAVPLTANTVYNDYSLQFNIDEPLHRWKLNNGLIDNVSELVAVANGMLSLQPSLFYEDAIVLKHIQSNRITFSSLQHTHGLHFMFNDFPYFGIWAAKDAPFVCLEPWCGIADSVNHNQQLTDKEGINTLVAGAVFTRNWSVECF